MGTRILIVDDHGVVRQGLRMYLALDPELEVVGEAANGAEALRLTHELNPDVVLMDLLMPVMDGIAANEAIRRPSAFCRWSLVGRWCGQVHRTKHCVKDRLQGSQFLLRGCDCEEVIGPLGLSVSQR
jgi:CheY-like chemotaxis protein